MSQGDDPTGNVHVLPIDLAALQRLLVHASDAPVATAAGRAQQRQLLQTAVTATQAHVDQISALLAVWNRGDAVPLSPGGQALEETLTPVAAELAELICACTQRLADLEAALRKLEDGAGTT